MSEAAVARANANKIFGCNRCSAQFETAELLDWHALCRHHDGPAWTREKIGRVSVISAVSQRLVQLVAQRGNACRWCGEPMRLDVESTHPLAPTREHLRPASLGGKRHPGNLALAHLSCNQLRGTITEEAFERLMNGEAVTREEMWPHIFSADKAV